MSQKLTYAFLFVLICIAVRLWHPTEVEEKVASSAKEPAAVVVTAPRQPHRVAAQRANRYDTSDFDQNTEFALGKPKGGEEIGLNTSGNHGPYDAEGKLIFPIDPRKRH